MCLYGRLLNLPYTTDILHMSISQGLYPFDFLFFTNCHPTYTLRAGAELKDDAVVGLREIYVALAVFI